MPEIEKIKKSVPEQGDELRPEVLIEKEISDREKIGIGKTFAAKKTLPPKEIVKIKPVTVRKQAANLYGLKRQRQVKILTDLALEKSIHHAVAVAKRLDSAYVLDEFHDTLVGQLFEELKKKGKIKEL